MPTGTYVTLQLPSVTPSLGECHALIRRVSLPDLGSPRRFATNHTCVITHRQADKGREMSLVAKANALKKELGIPPSMSAAQAVMVPGMRRGNEGRGRREGRTGGSEVVVMAASYPHLHLCVCARRAGGGRGVCTSRGRRRCAHTHGARAAAAAVAAAFGGLFS